MSTSFTSVANPFKRRRVVSHLLLAGRNPMSPPTAYASRTRQAPSNPHLTPLPFSSWLGSVGRAEDVREGWQIRQIAAGASHALMSYRSDGVDRVFSVGRNEVGQLGVGYNSQEATRGLVEGFRGDGVDAAGAGVQSSYLVLNEGGDRTSLWGFGSLQRGRLGQPHFHASEEVEDHKEPDLHILSQATKIPLPEGFESIKQLVVGFEHALLLSRDGEICGTGCNTDGQLGLGEGVLHDVYEFTKLRLPADVARDGVVSLSAGADTSALITKSGRLWTWGNSEYAQAMHGRKIDQIHSPTEVDLSFVPSSRKIVDFRCGGSFSLLLDDQGSVYSAGFGALGLGRETLESHAVKVIPKLEGEGITRIRAGWGWATAMRDDGPSFKIFTWGVNNVHGRLGLGLAASPSTSASKSSSPAHAFEPTEVELPLMELGLGADEKEWEFGEVECGEDALWVELRSEEAEVE